MFYRWTETYRSPLRVFQSIIHAIIWDILLFVQAMGIDIDLLERGHVFIHIFSNISRNAH